MTLENTLTAEFVVAIWAAIAVSIYWIEYVRGPQRISWLNRKPFNCEACLPFWLFAIFYAIAIYGYGAACGLIAAACTAGIITPIIIRLICKYYF